MKRLLVLIAALAVGAAPQTAGTLRRHPSNPRYFEFRGQPAVLITSGEHYGAVMNLDFDYIPYLNELQARGFNLTRTFSGMYVEGWGSPWNTLNPAASRYLAPWARSSTPGYPDGGNKFDLNQWNPAYFSRLRDFVAQAGQRGIVVELVLFCSMYNDSEWNLSPLKSTNNVNGVGTIPWQQIYNLSNAAVTAAQENLTTRIVQELNPYDNVYFEICNEPYFNQTTQAWHQRIADRITMTESSLPNKHLIAHNISNGSQTVTNPIGSVGILNFHYCSPPDAVAQNYGLGRVIAFDETGFRGTGPDPYRKEAWDFLIAGGAVYSNLDLSFTADSETGNSTAWQPHLNSSGGPVIRGQLRILKQFMGTFNFIAMAPNNGVIKGGVPTGAAARALVQTGEQYAIYLNNGSAASLVVELPANSYRAEWVNTKSGAVDKAEDFSHGGGNRTLVSPAYSGDIALRIKRTGSAPPPPPPPPPPANQTFYRAINLNGPGVTIDGRAWEGSAAPNYAFTGSSFENQSVTLSPSTDAARAQMIRSSIWNRDGSNVTLTNVPAGRYVVYLYVWEDNFSQTYTISVEGTVAQANYSSGGGGHWDRLGPWTRDVGDGTIQVTCSPGDANLSGIEVWRETTSPPALPVVTVTAPDAGASESGPNPGAFTVSRSGATTQSLSVLYAVGGTATPNGDYTALPGSVTIPAGSASAGIPVNVVNDSSQESNETVVVTLSPNAAYTVGSPSSATVTIADDDAAPPPPTGQTFYRAINLNGAAMTIDGNPWDASTAANYSFTGSSFANQSIALNPATDTNRATMIRSSIWNASGSNVTMSAVPDGQYVVYLYVWEDNFSQTYNISLEGQLVRSNYSSGSAGHWDKLGPWTTTVSDGTIRIQCSPGDANLSGLEVWRVTTAPPPPPPTDPALVVHWKLDEVTGGTAADASGKGNSGTLSPGGPVWTNGLIGGGLDFGGSGDLLTAPASASLNAIDGPMTAAFWIYKRANAPTYGSIVGRRFGTQWEDLWILFYNNSAGDEYSFGMTTSAGFATLTGPASTGDHNAWIHLAAVYTGSTMILYRNGVEVARRAHSGGMADQSSPLVAGGGDNGTSGFGEYVNAILDDVRIYSRALSASEVQGLASAGGVQPITMALSASAESSSGGSKDGGDGRCGLLGLEAAIVLAILRRRSKIR